MRRGPLTVGLKLCRGPVRHQTARPSPTLRSNLGARSPCIVRRRSVECLEGAPNGTRNDAVANLVARKLIYYCD
jgi:hypothetical protein